MLDASDVMDAEADNIFTGVFEFRLNSFLNKTLSNYEILVLKGRPGFSAGLLRTLMHTTTKNAA